jgi:hypothetical protein
LLNPVKRGPAIVTGLVVMLRELPIIGGEIVEP